MAACDFAYVVLIIGSALMQNSARASGRRECNNDYTCEWNSNVHGTDENQCCSDGYCHDSCTSDAIAAIIFFVLLPCLGCICCGLCIGIIVYFAMKNNQKGSRTVHNSTSAAHPPAYYSSQASPPYSTQYPPNFQSHPPPSTFPNNIQNYPAPGASQQMQTCHAPPYPYSQ
ncbi:uncharacterized protein LOC134845051 [Symsagittifera roscoffensis]|uniref:uncharacterized protein LOC134845051 n=1 Tax=Symsagittifera roscoffensis TaxID=84072 RepID=UPI00307C2AF0